MRFSVMGRDVFVLDCDHFMLRCRFSFHRHPHIGSWFPSSFAFSRQRDERDRDSSCNSAFTTAAPVSHLPSSLLSDPISVFLKWSALVFAEFHSWFKKTQMVAFQNTKGSDSLDAGNNIEMYLSMNETD